MQLESMFDIAYGTDENGVVCLEQQDYAGEMAAIRLTPEQLKIITNIISDKRQKRHQERF